MISDNNNRSLVVTQLTGGNDYLNTVVPYANELYYDNRPTVLVLDHSWPIGTIGGSKTDLDAFEPQSFPVLLSSDSSRYWSQLCQNLALGTWRGLYLL